ATAEACAGTILGAFDLLCVFGMSRSTSWPASGLSSNLPSVEPDPCAAAVIPITPRITSAIEIEIATRDRLDAICLSPLLLESELEKNIRIRAVGQPNA